MTQLPLTGAGPSAAGYIAKVKSYNPIAYWPLNELTGSTAVCQINTAQNGTYTGVTLGQSVTDASGVSFVCPLFDGSNDYASIYTTTFRDVFDEQEGTVCIWARVFNVGVWTDGSTRVSVQLKTDTNNQVFMQRRGANNEMRVRYEANNVAETRDVTSLTNINWMHWALSWSLIADEVKVYYDGSQQGATLTTLGTWQGVLGISTLIGAATGTPTNLWHGWLAHCAMWDSPLNATQIADLAVT